MPFGRDLAPGMLHRHPGHGEAVARITWCVDQHAIGVITGEVGAGKTVAVRAATAALDPSRAELVTRLTRQVVAEHRLTTLMVTHNMSQALEVGNRLIMMHDGRIILELDEQEKAGRTPADLLAEFAKIKGAVVDDKTMLS